MGPGTPTFSVAMAAYNGERYLPEQLESLRRQTHPPAELVVCDDGSTDGTLEILRRFADEAGFPVRIYENERNVGYAETFLRAAGLCTGAWVAFCDQDDVWAAHKLARLGEVVRRHPDVTLVSHSAEQVDADLRPLAKRFPNHRRFSIRAPLANPPIAVLPGFSCCVRWETLDRVPADGRPCGEKSPDLAQTHDEFLYNVANTYGRVVRLPDALVLYRRHGGALTGEGGSRVHEQTRGRRLRDGLRATSEGYRRRAGQAEQHRAYYQRILERAEAGGPADGGPADGMFLRRTRHAAAYYGRLAWAFETRAALYADAASFRERLAAFARNVRARAYVGTPLGRGLGGKALAKDLARVLVR